MGTKKPPGGGVNLQRPSGRVSTRLLDMVWLCLAIDDVLSNFQLLHLALRLGERGFSWLSNRVIPFPAFVLNLYVLDCHG